LDTVSRTVNAKHGVLYDALRLQKYRIRIAQRQRGGLVLLQMTEGANLPLTARARRAAINVAGQFQRVAFEMRPLVMLPSLPYQSARRRGSNLRTGALPDEPEIAMPLYKVRMQVQVGESPDADQLITKVVGASDEMMACNMALHVLTVENPEFNAAKIYWWDVGRVHGTSSNAR